MNVYVGGINVSNYYENNYYYPIDQQLDAVTLSQIRLKIPKVATLVQYRPNLPETTLCYNGVEIDLCALRTRIALYGHKQGLVDIYGGGWPNRLSLESSGRQTDWKERKLALLQPYRFNLCFENTNFPHYCTEKIWHSIKAGCLPIYQGSGNRIYDDFPEESFLDWACFGSGQRLFDYLQKMSIEEVVDRLNKCITVFNDIHRKLHDHEEFSTQVIHQGLVFRTIDRIKMIVNGATMAN